MSDDTEELCVCGHDFGQHSKGPVPQDYCRHCPCQKWQLATAEPRLDQLIKYWEAKAQSHRQWPEGSGFQTQSAVLAIYTDTIAALMELRSIDQ